MTKKRYAKLARAFVTNVRIWSKENGRPISHGKELYRCADPRKAWSLMEVNGKIYNRREWFDLCADTMRLFNLDAKEVRAK